MTLRNPVEFRSGEARLSLTSRLAAANGFKSMHDFVSITGTSIRSIHFGEPDAIAMLSGWSGFDPEVLSAHRLKTVQQGATWKLGEAMMSRDMLPGYRHRYCPKCVACDLTERENDSHLGAYVRVIWTTRAIRHCPQHGCSIVEERCEPHELGDFARFASAYRDRIMAQSAAAKPARAFELDKYIEGRIKGLTANAYLDGLETFVAFDLCKYLGNFHRANFDSGRPPGPRPGETEEGFAIASSGPARIEAVVAEAIDRVKPQASEAKSVFGKLRVWLLRNYQRTEYSSVVELFQDIAERHMPLGPEDVFVLPTRKRHLHSLRSASIEYNLMEERVYQLLLRAGLVQKSDLPSSRIYFDAEKGNRVLAEAAETLNTSDIARHLGIDIDVARTILDAGLIPRVENVGRSRIYSRIRLEDYNAFYAKLDIRILDTGQSTELVDTPAACMRARCRNPEIFELAVQGQIKLYRSRDSDGALLGLKVDPAELREAIVEKRRRIAAARRRDDNSSLFAGDNLIDGEDITRRLKASGCTGHELLKLGFLEQVDAVCPTTWRKKKYTTRKSLATFMKHHVSLSGLANECGTPPRLLRHKLYDLGIRPIFEQSEVGSRTAEFYRRADIRKYL